MGVVDEAAAYLSGRGHRVARRFVERQGLPTSMADDVVQEALVAVRRAERAGKTIDNVEAYVTTVLRNTVVSVFRGELRRADGAVASRRAPVAVDDVEIADVPASELAFPAQTVWDLRRAVGHRLTAESTAAAGALAVLATADPLDPAVPADDCPKPKKGATPQEALSWVGLFYAGLLDSWADRDDQTVRKRRSRRAARQQLVLEQAAAAIGVRGESDHA